MNVAATCKTFSVSKNLNIARGFFGALASVLLLSTLIAFGANMDYANFPGSNMVFKVSTETDTEGELVRMPGGEGFELADAFTNNCEDNLIITVINVDKKYCQGVKDDEPEALVLVGEDGGAAPANANARGWTVMPPCVKTNKLSDCAPFGVDSALSGLGQAFFGVLAINAVLHAAHTGVELGKPDSMEMNTANVLFALNIVWGILTFSLFVWSAVAWRGLCDKIDTGLGRHVSNTPGCATEYCTISFGGFFASFAVAFVVYRIPDMLVMFGVLGLERADGRQAVYDDDDL